MPAKTYAYQLPTGILRDFHDEFRTSHSSGNYLIVQAGMATFERRSILYVYDGLGTDLKPGGLVPVPDGSSKIVIRCDYKDQLARIIVLQGGWRQTLARWWNYLTRRYVDIPIADVTCQDGVVVQVEDTRQFSEYHVG